MNRSEPTCDLTVAPSLAVGNKVEARFRGDSEWFAGKVAGINSDGSVHVRYEDGDDESAVLREHVRSTEQVRCKPRLPLHIVRILLTI